MSASRIGQPATPLSRTLASIHSWQGSPGLNPREILRTLDRLISERLWEGETGWDGQPMTLRRALVEPWPVGVGLSYQGIERLFALAEDADIDPELIQRVRLGIDKAVRPGPQGAHTPGSSSSARRGALPGSQGQYTRARLLRDRPDLHARVLAGDLTLNAAATEAGFRRPQRTVSIETPAAAVKALLRVFTADELRAALGEVAEP